MQNAPRPAPPAAGWKAKNLVSVDDLTTDEIRFVLDLAEHYAGFLKQGARPPQRLAGKTQINLFYEDSTRTNLSFALAGQKLGADVLNVPVAASSVNKGETELDTAQTLTAMGAHALILRHKQPRIHEQLAHAIPCPILNAGDGVREHPTQALLDAAAIRSVYGEVKGLIIAICGDIRPFTSPYTERMAAASRSACVGCSRTPSPALRMGQGMACASCS
ncbi:MAG: hypothetical protein RIC52_14305, partial [Amphiplicatus sp.]